MCVIRNVANTLLLSSHNIQSTDLLLIALDQIDKRYYIYDMQNKQLRLYIKKWPIV